jgi:hypothetical protein
MTVDKIKVTRNVAKILAFLFVLESFLFAPPGTDAATQNAWRWRNDDGTEATATWKAAENTAITDVDKNVVQRLRFGVNQDSNDETLARQGALTNAVDERVISSVVDTGNGFAYLGTRTSPARVVKVNLATFERVGHIELPDGFNELYTAVIDTANGFAYFGTYTSPARVAKIDLSSFTLVDTITFASGENQAYAATIDATGGFAYFSTYTQPAKIVKIDLSTFRQVDTLDLANGENLCTGAAADPANDRVYFVCLNGGFGGVVVRIDTDTFTKAGSSLTMDGFGFAPSGVEIDTTNGYLYMGSWSTPSYLTKVDLSTFTQVTAHTISMGNSVGYTNRSSTYDGSTFGYWSMYAETPVVVKINLGNGSSAPTVSTSLTLDDSDYYSQTAFIDTSGATDYAYFPTYSFPSQVVKLDLSSFTRDSALKLSGDSSAGYYHGTIDADNGFAYMCTGFPPAAIHKIRLSDLTHVATVELDGMENVCTHPVIDSTAGYLYAAGHDTVTGETGARVYRVDLDDFSASGLSVINLGVGDDNATSMVVDETNGFLYVGTSTSPGRVAKVNTSTFSYVTSITVGANGLDSAVIDVGNGFAYFGGEGTPGQVSKVDIDPSNSFAHITTITLPTGADNINEISIDLDNLLAYAVASADPGYVAKIDIDPNNTFQAIGPALSLGSGETTGSFLDDDSTYLYVGTFTSPAKVHKIRTSDMTKLDTITMNTGENQFNYGVVFDPNTGYGYGGTWTTPARLVRFSTETRLAVQYAVKSGSCAASTGWQTANSENGAWRIADAAGLASGDATTDSAGLTNGGTTFVASEQVEGSTVNTSGLQLGSNEFTEVEFGLRPTVAAQDGATYCFRLANDNSASNFTYSGYAEATLAGSTVQVTASSATLTRNKAGETTDFAMEFTLPSAQSTQFEIVFPIGFTVNSAFTAGTCSGGGTIGTFAVGANSVTITADKSSCAGTVSLSGASLTLPSTPGIYRVTYVNDSPGEVIIPVLDDDQVSVTGNIDPTMTFDLDVSVVDADSDALYAVDFGTVAPGTPEVSGMAGQSIPSIWIDLATNATGGVTVTVSSLNEALQSTSSPSDEIETTTQALTVGGEAYGICVASATGTQDGGDTFVAQSPFAATCDGTSSSVVGTLPADTSPGDLLVASGPLSGGRAQVRVGISVDTSTPAHPDYTDTLTFLATGTY